MAYQGPNVSVTQKFVATPPATAIENLPPAGVGTAYNVFSKELLGQARGIHDQELLWGNDNVIWEEGVIGSRLYNFYPANVYASTKDFGYVPLTVTKTADGVTIPFSISGTQQQYIIPNTSVAEGVCKAFIPFYKSKVGTDNAYVLTTDAYTVVAVGAAFATAKIQPGQSVLIGDEATPTSFKLVGTVASVGSDETKLRLKIPYTAGIEGDTIIVGVSTTVSAGAFVNQDQASYFYDPDGKFLTNKVTVGDIINFKSNAVSTTDTYSATIISVDEKLIQFNTIAPDTGKEDYDFYKFKTSEAAPASTVAITSYSVTRFAGFSQNYGFKDIGTGIIAAAPTSGVQIKITLAQNAPILSKGDFIAATTIKTPSGANLAAAGWHQIDTVTTDGTHQIYTTLDIVTDETGATYSTGAFIHAWHPIIKTDIVSDFRAVRTEENQVVHRITSPQDIKTAWGTITPYNELAYAMSIALAAAGGNVCYGVNVNSTSISLATEYAEALESLKMYDVYSHFICTTDGGVNALMSPYCLEQSEPYEAHERIAVVAYDSNDVYLQGVDTGALSSGTITINGAINLPIIGVNQNDLVDIYSSSGVYQETVTVLHTPSATAPYVCVTNGAKNYSAGTVFKFMSGRKDDQATKISNLAAGDRRLTIVWPGWFQGDINGSTLTLPPYFITAAITGMDSLNIASQSFTNREFAMSGISNIKLNTNTYFRKAQLDTIGGGGIDIMIQDGTVSQTIRSRHDLTTNMDAVEYRERSITKQADVAAKTLRTSINPYVGKYNITQSLLSFISQVCAIAAGTLVKNGVVAGVNVGAVVRDPNIADKINIDVTTTVFVAGNYYDIQMLVVSR